MSNEREIIFKSAIIGLMIISLLGVFINSVTITEVRKLLSNSKWECAEYSNNNTYACDYGGNNTSLLLWLHVTNVSDLSSMVNKTPVFIELPHELTYEETILIREFDELVDWFWADCNKVEPICVEETLKRKVV